MDNQTILTISEGPPLDCQKVLEEFNTLHEKSKDFKSIDLKTKELLWDAVFSRIKLQNDMEIIKTCLNTLRLLSREKFTLEEVMTDDRVAALLIISGLKITRTTADEQIMLVEGLKVIFNMVFQSSTLQVMFISNGILNHLIARVEDFTRGNNYSLECQYFATRILFLITALCKDTAPAKVRNLMNGLQVLNDYLENKVNEGDGFMRADIICEILKVLYNIIADLSPKNKINESLESEIDPEDLEQCRRAGKLSRLLLLETWSQNISSITISTSLLEDSNDASIKQQHQEEIRRHTVDLLASLPSPCFEELIPEAMGVEDPDFIYLERDISSVESTVEYLDIKLDEMYKSVPKDTLAAPLYDLHNMATSSRVIRKYLKQRILPPLKKTDVVNLPEVGKSTRNKLCSLLTSPVSHITDLVANLLFLLCKENVGKYIKYAGYGNAAGLLANKGLMLGGMPPRGKYSDDDMDESDTEEYKEIEHMINQVEGRIQQDRPNPMEGMTDEQKEFEAMKLINAIDKMERHSGIKPCKIGADGRPAPIDHVLQLQEALENPMRGMRRDSDSDSD